VIVRTEYIRGQSFIYPLYPVVIPPQRGKIKEEIIYA